MGALDCDADGVTSPLLLVAVVEEAIPLAVDSCAEPAMSSSLDVAASRRLIRVVRLFIPVVAVVAIAVVDWKGYVAEEEIGLL